MSETSSRPAAAQFTGTREPTWLMMRSGRMPSSLSSTSIMSFSSTESCTVSPRLVAQLLDDPAAVAHQIDLARDRPCRARTACGRGKGPPDRPTAPDSRLRTRCGPARRRSISESQARSTISRDRDRLAALQHQLEDVQRAAHAARTAGIVVGGGLGAARCAHCAISRACSWRIPAFWTTVQYFGLLRHVNASGGDVAMKITRHRGDRAARSRLDRRDVRRVIRQLRGSRPHRRRHHRHRRGRQRALGHPRHHRSAALAHPCHGSEGGRDRRRSRRTSRPVGPHVRLDQLLRPARRRSSTP